MIEIVLGIYLLSFTFSMGLVAWNYLAVTKEIGSESLRTVNLNLQKIGYFWSLSRENFAKLSEFSVEADATSAKRSTLMLGLLALGSAIGFFLLLAITLAMRFLKSHRRTRAVFESELAIKTDLSSVEVESLFREFSQIT